MPFLWESPVSWIAVTSVYTFLIFTGWHPRAYLGHCGKRSWSGYEPLWRPKFTFKRWRKILYWFDLILRRLPHHDSVPSGRTVWGGGLRRSSAAARRLRLWVGIPPGSSMFGCCDGCVLHDRGLCDELITHPEENYRAWCIVKCDLETSWIRRHWPPGGCRAKTNKPYHERKCHCTQGDH